MDFKHWLGQRYHHWLPHLPARQVYHRDFFQVLALLEAPAEARQKAVDWRLRHVLGVAARHVPFYRRMLRLTEGELAYQALPALLARFPYVDKDIVMERRRDFLDERVVPRRLHCAYSSGSSGKGATAASTEVGDAPCSLAAARTSWSTAMATRCPGRR